MLLRTLKTAKVKVRSYGNSKNGDKQMHKFVLDLIKLKKLDYLLIVMDVKLNKIMKVTTIHPIRKK